MGEIRRRACEDGEQGQNICLVSLTSSVELTHSQCLLSDEVKQIQSPSSAVVKPQSHKGKRSALLASGGGLARPHLAVHPDLYQPKSCLKGAYTVPACDYSKHFLSENRVLPRVSQTHPLSDFWKIITTQTYKAHPGFCCQTLSLSCSPDQSCVIINTLWPMAGTQ